MVAGFRQWQAKGRQVRKGEKSIKIFGYREKKADRDDDTHDEAAGDGRRVIRYFPNLSAFDIAQTDPIEGPNRCRRTRPDD
jgi:antirestriction protein ArdC